MGKIAVLGPKGTFTEVAAKQYIKALGLEVALEYYSSIRRTFNAIGDTCELGVIPIENTLDGFVQIILDLLTHSGLKIIHEIVLPIKFVFVANCNKLSDVTRVYTQFKTENQCADFLEKFNNTEIITTASNSKSFLEASKGIKHEAAIIPHHMLGDRSSFGMVIEDIADLSDNETRFIVLANRLNSEVVEGVAWKTLFVVSDYSDRPGLLRDILTAFADRKINLNSIISMPAKTGLGNYNFFIEIDGCYCRDEPVKDAVQKIMKEFTIRILGSYYRKI